MVKSVQQRLLDRLREEGFDLPARTELFRTFAQFNDRRNGAWSWFAMVPAKPCTHADDVFIEAVELKLGSQYSMALLLRAERWEIFRHDCGDTSICIPDDLLRRV